MTWSMFAINYLDVGLTNKAQIYFEKAYKSYIRPEFKVRQPSFYRCHIVFILDEGGRRVIWPTLQASLEKINILALTLLLLNFAFSGLE